MREDDHTVPKTMKGYLMSHYIDGFAFPIRNDRLADYKKLAESVAVIWKEHGAIEYLEFAGDDMHLPGTRSFSELANETETVLFGWVTFESKEMRDRVNKLVANDPRMAELMRNFEVEFDTSRMMYGGFQSFVGQNG